MRPSNFAELVAIMLDIISILIPLIFGITLVIVLWGVIKTWIMNPGDANQVESGKRMLLAAIIALVLMVSVYGIVQIIQSGLFGV